MQHCSPYLHRAWPVLDSSLRSLQRIDNTGCV
jgi:hypothetical protein